VTLEQPNEEIKKDLNADGFCTKRFFTTEAGRSSGGAEFQAALALTIRGDAGEWVLQDLDIADGRVRGCGDPGEKGAGCGTEVLGKLGELKKHIDPS
jgi:hypothetical protein